jgi:hypothetical protein
LYIKEFPLSRFSKDLERIKNKILEGARWKYQFRKEIK